jgi:hypothetical protein
LTLLLDEAGQTWRLDKHGRGMCVQVSKSRDFISRSQTSNRLLASGAMKALQAAEASDLPPQATQGTVGRKCRQRPRPGAVVREREEERGRVCVGEKAGSRG